MFDDIKINLFYSYQKNIFLLSENYKSEQSRVKLSKANSTFPLISKMKKNLNNFQDTN